jgi:hypothetical protein
MALETGLSTVSIAFTLFEHEFYSNKYAFYSGAGWYDPKLRLNAK